MTLLSVPPLDDEPFPSLGGQVCDFIESSAVFGPGSLKGEPAKLDDEKRGIIWRAYEVFPKGHPREGRRRFQRVGVSLPKGSSKTEILAWIAYAELHPEGPVRFDGWDAYGNPVGRPVNDPYIPLVGVSEEQTEELAYGALYVVCTEGPDADLFDTTLERILRLDSFGRADGKATALAGSPNSRDGARTTFQGFDEPMDLTTPVPTTAGWSTIGDVAPGDEVFGRDGRPVRVIGASPVHVGRPCFRVTFRDGTSVVTDGGHKWCAIDWANRPLGEQVVTTQQMHERGTETGYGLRWRLPRNRGVDGAHRDLPIDPYLLGLWLGDGSSDAGYINTSPEDYLQLSAGIAHTVSNDARKALVRWLPTGLRSLLRTNGLLGRKHIPEEYRLASREQRVALLQGLMDSDGYTTPTGNCVFVQNAEPLSRQVLELVRSLGDQASIRSQKDPRSRTGLMWKVQFSPSFCPFRLHRKVSRHDWAKPSNATWWPAIKSIEPVDSVPVRCIAVDNDDHLFVVGTGFHLTHNTHRLYLPRARQAHQTMLANLTKRPLDDPWHMEVTTAGELGQNSIAEDTHREAEAIRDGEYLNPDLLYHHRQAGNTHDMKTLAGRTAAVAEARGGVGEYAPGQFEDIARQWDRPKADKEYLERVWLNRWIKSNAQAFDPVLTKELAVEGGRIPRGELVTLGFDGARFRDSTALVATDVQTGLQECLAVWERPLDLPEEADWEVPEVEVTDAVRAAMKDFQVWKLFADPPHWTETVASWSARWPDHVEEWWTNRPRPMAHSIRAYNEARRAGEVRYADGPLSDLLQRHLAAAGRRTVNVWHEDEQLYILEKIHPDRKFDAGMAAVLSWTARIEAVAKGAKKKVRRAPQRVR